MSCNIKNLLPNEFTPVTVTDMYDALRKKQDKISTYPSFNALPLTGINYGDLAITTDTNKIYWYNTSWVELSPSAGGSNPAPETDPVYTADKPNLALKTEVVSKQDKTDNTLTTTSKSVIGAINEVNAKPETDPVYTLDKPTLALKSEVALKQDLTDNALTTTSKSVVGAINEVKALVLSGGSGSAETDPIYMGDKHNIALKTEVNLKQDKLSVDNIANINRLGNDVLPTNAQTTNGAIKEIFDTELPKLQPINNNSLTTTSKSVIGAINEVNAKPTGILTENDPLYNADKPNIALKSDVNLKQDKTDNTLITTNKTIVGAINELKTNVEPMTYVNIPTNGVLDISLPVNRKTATVFVDFTLETTPKQTAITFALDGANVPPVVHYVYHYLKGSNLHHYEFTLNFDKITRKITKITGGVMTLGGNGTPPAFQLVDIGYNW